MFVKLHYWNYSGDRGPKILSSGAKYSSALPYFLIIPQKSTFPRGNTFHGFSSQHLRIPAVRFKRLKPYITQQQ